jgi:hypothetical protein
VESVIETPDVARVTKSGCRDSFRAPNRNVGDSARKFKLQTKEAFF